MVWLRDYTNNYEVNDFLVGGRIFLRLNATFDIVFCSFVHFQILDKMDTAPGLRHRDEPLELVINQKVWNLNVKLPAKNVSMFS